MPAPLAEQRRGLLLAQATGSRLYLKHGIRRMGL
nr:MAG TPA: hypothetical protein [Caudoviricetes sp.]